MKLAEEREVTFFYPSQNHRIWGWRTISISPCMSWRQTQAIMKEAACELGEPELCPDLHLPTPTSSGPEPELQKWVFAKSACKELTRASGLSCISALPLLCSGASWEGEQLGHTSSFPREDFHLEASLKQVPSLIPGAVSSSCSVNSPHLSCTLYLSGNRPMLWSMGHYVCPSLAPPPLLACSI